MHVYLAWILLPLMTNIMNGVSDNLWKGNMSFAYLKHHISDRRYCRNMLKNQGFFQVNLLKSKFNFHQAFNYKKEQDLDAALRRLVSPSLYSWASCINEKHICDCKVRMLQLFSFLCHLLAGTSRRALTSTSRTWVATHWRPCSPTCVGFMVFDYFSEYHKFKLAVLPYWLDDKVFKKTIFSHYSRPFISKVFFKIRAILVFEQ